MSTQTALVIREHRAGLGYKVKACDEYLNEVSGKWLPVPPHWVGLWSSEVSHLIWIYSSK